MEFIKNFMQEEDGVTAIEYGLIAALIAVVIVVAVSQAGGSLKLMFEKVAACLGSAQTAAAGAATC